MSPEDILRKFRFVAVAAVLLAGLTGCGTILNFAMGVPPQPGSALEMRTEIYGGVQVDAHAVRTAGDTVEPWWFRVFAFLFIFDFPLSLVADTITLPITIPIALSRN